MRRRRPEDGSQRVGGGGWVGAWERWARQWRDEKSPLLDSKHSASVFVLTGAADVKQQQSGSQKELYIYPVSEQAFFKRLRSTPIELLWQTQAKGARIWRTAALGLGLGPGLGGFPLVCCLVRGQRGGLRNQMALFGFPQEVAQPLARSYTNTEWGGRNKGGAVSVGERKKWSRRCHFGLIHRQQKKSKRKKRCAGAQVEEAWLNTQPFLCLMNTSCEHMWTELDESRKPYGLHINSSLLMFKVCTVWW